MRFLNHPIRRSFKSRQTGRFPWVVFVPSSGSRSDRAVPAADENKQPPPPRLRRQKRLRDPLRPVSRRHNGPFFRLRDLGGPKPAVQKQTFREISRREYSFTDRHQRRYTCYCDWRTPSLRAVSVAVSIDGRKNCPTRLLIRSGSHWVLLGGCGDGKLENL